MVSSVKTIGGINFTIDTGDLNIMSSCGNKVESDLTFEVVRLSDINNQIKLVSYQPVIKSVSLILVHEENDDVQNVNIGLSTPNSNTVVVHWGNNKFLDTKPAGDDQISINPITDEKSIIAGTNKICDTQANGRNILSSDYNRTTIKNWFDDYYGKSLVKWNVDLTVHTCIVNYDLNNDKQIDVSSATWNTPEMVIVENKCHNSTKNYNLFFVDNPDDGSNGFMDFNQKFGFIHVLNSSAPHTTSAHELGHGSFSLRHPFDQFKPCFPTGSKDIDNIMNYGNSRNKFRKYQWDLMH